MTTFPILQEQEQHIMILDCTSYPRPCLAELAEGTRAICSALSDICWFCDFNNKKNLEFNDQVTMTVIEVGSNLTLNANKSNFTVQVAYTDGHLKENILEVISKRTSCKFCLRDITMPAQ